MEYVAYPNLHRFIQLRSLAPPQIHNVPP
jgi:serine/threonine protein kinase